MLITSVDNKKIKDVVRLKQKKYRDLENKFIIETKNLLKEAASVNALEEVYLLEGENLGFPVNCPIYFLKENVMDKIKGINTSSCLGICKKTNNTKYAGKRYLMLDNISDPGNLGTIMRSSLAFNIDTLIVSNDSCDIYNDKVIRASEGAIFKLNIVVAPLEKALNIINNLDIPLYGTDVVKGESIENINKERFCVVMGNEGNGISENTKKRIKRYVHIKTSKVESLNVAVATSIILYELNK